MLTLDRSLSPELLIPGNYDQTSIPKIVDSVSGELELPTSRTFAVRTDAIQILGAEWDLKRVNG